MSKLALIEEDYTDDFKHLFAETPTRSKKAEKPVRKPVNRLQGVSSMGLVGELFKRHYLDLQIAGFWLLLTTIVWLRLG